MGTDSGGIAADLAVHHPFAGGPAAALEEATGIVSDARIAGVEARLLGGVAIALRCDDAHPGARLARPFSDLDVVVGARSSGALERALVQRGYEPDAQFNALQGGRRLIFDHPEQGHLDVFVDEFAMCHRLDLRDRFGFDDRTLSLADLLLTKLQVAEITLKDVVDVCALLLDHDLGADPEGIDASYVSGLLARDWGWWRTVTENLGVVGDRIRDLGLSEADVHAIQTRLEALRGQIDDSEKTRRWKLRARAGDRLPWREDPEESRE